MASIEAVKATLAQSVHHDSTAQSQVRAALESIEQAEHRLADAATVAQDGTVMHEYRNILGWAKGAA
jgi:hypothetical protein